jgi:hypothetical protein
MAKEMLEDTKEVIWLQITSLVSSNISLAIVFSFPQFNASDYLFGIF